MSATPSEERPAEDADPGRHMYQGLLGAIAGAGIGAAVETAARSRRALLVLAGCAAAFAVHLSSEAIRAGTSPAAGGVRHAIALLPPLGTVAVVVWLGLRRERDVIGELEEEVQRGVVTDEDIESLRRPRLLRKAYLKSFGTGDIERLSALRSLHNRQLQLAMAKRRAGGEADETRALRQSIEALREKLDATREASGRSV